MTDRALESPAAVSPAPGPRLAGFAGVTAPLLFVLLVVLQSVLAPDYSNVTSPISALAAHPMGWIQNLNFIQFGALFVVFALGLCRAVRDGRGRALARAFLVLGGLGGIGLGFTPWRNLDGAPVEPIGHTIAVFLFFLPIAAGFILISRRMRADPRWRDRAAFTLASAIAIFVLFFAFGALAESEGTPLHPVEGLFQRALAAVLILVTTVLGARLSRIGRAE